MRIASLTNSPLDPALGSGKTVLAWTQGFQALGHEVEVLAPEHYYRELPGGKGKRLKMRWDARRLKRRLLEGDFDIVEFYGAEFGWLIDGLSQCSRKDRPMLVAHTNGLELLAARVPENQTDHHEQSRLRTLARSLTSPWFRHWDERAFSCVDAFAAICQTDADYIITHRFQPKERCAVVEPGLDQVYRDASWDGQKSHWLVTLGSWTLRKDPATMGRVVSQLLKSDPELKFHVLGAGWAGESIRSAFAAEIRDRVVVHPRLEEGELVAVLSRAKVFFFPSLYEGFGMATTEAMACGCAVVVTPTGFGASIQDGQDGFVCDFGDAEAMASRIQDLLRNETLRSQIAAAGRARIEGLVWKDQVQKLDQLYQRWLTSK